jgi:formate hydrogenlyase subunit 3/multisubunit Na+/H+ antiporter MnhD subunit
MDKNLAILMLLPLILSQLSFMTKKFYNLFFVIQILVSILCLEQTINIPISDKIYPINLGFFELKFNCDIYSYFFGILISVVFILTILYSYSYFKHPNYYQNKNPNFIVKTVPLTMKIAIISGVILSIFMSFFINDLIVFFKEYDV